MSTIKKISDGSVQGGVSPDPYAAYYLWNANDAGLRDQIYGPTRSIEGACPPHNHGNDGGEILDDALLCVTFGRHTPEGTGPSFLLIGLPYGQIIGSTSFLDADDTSSKLMAASPLLIRGGVSQMAVNLKYKWSGAGNLTFHVCLVAFDKINYRSLTQGLYQSITVTPTGGAGHKNLTVSFSDLSLLGDARLDRIVELQIFQGAYPPAATQYLCAVEVAKTTTSTGRLANSNDPPRAKVQIGDLLNGVISPELTNRIRRVENGHSISLLGRAPGLNKDLTPDKRRDYEQRIFHPHQHQGQLCPESDGTLYSDGAIVQRPLVTAVYPCNLGDVPLGNIDRFPVKGIKIDPSGVKGATWAHFRYRCSVPAGLGAAWLFFALQPGTSDINTRLKINTDLRTIGGTSIVSKVSSGNIYQSEAALSSDGYFICEADPLNNDAFVSNNLRRNRFGTGRGLWTQDALLATSQRPAGLQSTSFSRVSQAVRLDLQHKGVRSTDNFRDTQDCMFNLRLELATLNTGNYDAGARLLWVFLIPEPGW
jgi:hypothetical protein